MAAKNEKVLNRHTGKMETCTVGYGCKRHEHYNKLVDAVLAEKFKNVQEQLNQMETAKPEKSFSYTNFEGKIEEIHDKINNVEKEWANINEGASAILSEEQLEDKNSIIEKFENVIQTSAFNTGSIYEYLYNNEEFCETCGDKIDAVIRPAESTKFWRSNGTLVNFSEYADGGKKIGYRKIHLIHETTGSTYCIVNTCPDCEGPIVRTLDGEGRIVYEPFNQPEDGLDDYPYETLGQADAQFWSSWEHMSPSNCGSDKTSPTYMLADLEYIVEENRINPSIHLQAFVDSTNRYNHMFNKKIIYPNNEQPPTRLKTAEDEKKGLMDVPLVREAEIRGRGINEIIKQIIIRNGNKW
jgi:hypothetical protein